MGRGIYAIPSQKTAQNEAESFQSANDRSDLIIDERILQVQVELLDLCDEFVAVGYENGPLQAIGNLLHHWLATPIVELSMNDEGHQLGNALLITRFLSELLKANEPKGTEGLRCE